MKKLLIWFVITLSGCASGGYCQRYNCEVSLDGVCLQKNYYDKLDVRGQ